MAKGIWNEEETVVSDDKGMAEYQKTIFFPIGVPNDAYAQLAFEIPGEDAGNEWLEAVDDKEYQKLK